jgi:hypothetical protein
VALKIRATNLLLKQKVIMKKIINKHYPRTYKSWRSMKNRCTNVNHNRYSVYGAKGITICDRWTQSFSNFLEDMGERPQDTSLERIDNNKGYSPDNCKWATRVEQANNTSKNKWVTYNNCVMTLAECVRKAGADYSRTKDRLRIGWSLEDALTKPRRGLSA